MKTWNPIDNKKFETLSYLPPLTEESIAKEVDYMIKKGWIPCLEFDAVGYVRRENSTMPGYYDGRYWTLWIHKCSMKSMSVKRHTRMLISAVWHLTTSARFSAWLLLSKNLPLPLPPPPQRPRCFHFTLASVFRLLGF